MRLSITLDKEEEKILKRRAKKNLMSIREQAEDIIRRSCVNSKKNSKPHDPCDDKLVKIFSKQNKGRKPKKKKGKKK
jgi:hypothetical protein